MAQLFTELVHSTFQIVDAMRIEILIVVLTVGFQLLLYRLGKTSPSAKTRGSSKLPAAEKKGEAALAGSQKALKTPKPVKADMSATINYNIRIKEQLEKGNFQCAREVMESMKAAGTKPNIVTFNELLDATVLAEPPQDAWKIITEMKAAGVAPNNITCSILWKGVHAGRKGVEPSRALAAMEEMRDDMDEVLLSSSLEACIRISRADLLKSQLTKFWEEKRISVQGAPTFGSIIRAYGVIHDVDGACKAWREMRRRKIQPTSITLGCALEALGSNQHPDAAYQLILELLADGEIRPLVNAVNYCSVLKGFSHQKRFDMVWTVYQEMLRHGLESQFTSVTYNTLIDACARCGKVSRTPDILKQMMRNGIEPNLVTYSVYLKGLCQDNQLDKAFELMETMTKSQDAKPDELAYNTLLDGCARQGLYDRGMQVFAMMQAAGIKPSNFTLSILVKLANRGKKLERAFELSRELPLEYNFRINLHVYNNLIQGCIMQKNFERAVDTLASMFTDGVSPDVRTYTLFIQGCVNHGEAARGAEFVRAALGLPGATPPRLEPFCAVGGIAKLKGAVLPGELCGEVVQACLRRHQNNRAAELLQELRKVPGLQLDGKLLHQVIQQHTKR